jgi:hypothetical protein
MKKIISGTLKTIFELLGLGAAIAAGAFIGLKVAAIPGAIIGGTAAGVTYLLARVL